MSDKYENQTLTWLTWRTVEGADGRVPRHGSDEYRPSLGDHPWSWSQPDISDRRCSGSAFRSKQGDWWI